MLKRINIPPVTVRAAPTFHPQYRHSDATKTSWGSCRLLMAFHTVTMHPGFLSSPEPTCLQGSMMPCVLWSFPLLSLKLTEAPSPVRTTPVSAGAPPVPVSYTLPALASIPVVTLDFLRVFFMSRCILNAENHLYPPPLPLPSSRKYLIRQGYNNFTYFTNIRNPLCARKSTRSRRRHNTCPLGRLSLMLNILTTTDRWCQIINISMISNVEKN